MASHPRAALSTICLALALALACSPLHSAASDAGAGGDPGTADGPDPSAGSPETAGASHGIGGSATAGAAGDAAEAGAVATGGDSSADGGLVSGTVHVPAGESAVGVVVAACVPDSAGDCDATLSVTFEVTAKSGAFSFAGPAQPFYLIGWQDADQDQMVSPGDLFGGVLDKDNNLLELSAPASALSFDVVLIPQATAGSIPAELVGTWRDGLAHYVFDADGSYGYASIETTSVDCLIYSKEEVSAAGTAVAQGNQLTLTRKSATYTTWDCLGQPSAKPVSLMPQVFTYSISSNAQGVPELHLGDVLVYTKQ